MNRLLLSSATWIFVFALSGVSCRVRQAPLPQTPVPETPVPGTPVPQKPAAVFQLTPSPVLRLCTDPILHGLDTNGDKLWSKTFLDGEVRCGEAETVQLAEIRIEHPYLALRRGLRFAAPPVGRVRVDYEFFGDCLVQLGGRTRSDLGAHLVLYRLDRESSLEAVFNGRSEILDTLQPLLFQRLPIGRYAVALFREDPWAAGEPYLREVVSVRPCQESVIPLTGAPE